MSFLCKKINNWVSFRVPAIMTDRKAVVKNADMSEDMQQEAVDVATQVCDPVSRECDH